MTVVHSRGTSSIICPSPGHIELDGPTEIGTRSPKIGGVRLRPSALSGRAPALPRRGADVTFADPGVVACADSVAFASIGSGKSHADSYFMLVHHTRFAPFHKALLDT